MEYTSRKTSGDEDSDESQLLHPMGIGSRSLTATSCPRLAIRWVAVGLVISLLIVSNVAVWVQLCKSRQAEEVVPSGSALNLKRSEYFH